MSALKEISLFQGLSDSELASLQTCLREKKFEQGEILHAESDVCERVFIVQKGRVKVYRTASSGREQILETLGPGDTCACNPGKVDWHCITTAEAITPCVVWFFSRADYLKIVQSSVKISSALNQIFADRLKCFSSLIEDVSLKDAKKRLVKFILDMLAKKNRIAKDGKEPLFVPYTRQEIAQRIGTARETVARHLYQLKREKLIDVKPHQIVVLSEEGLKKALL